MPKIRFNSNNVMLFFCLFVCFFLSAPVNQLTEEFFLDFDWQGWAR